MAGRKINPYSNKQKVLALIKYKGVSPQSIAHQIGISVDTARTIANNLVSDGVIESYWSNNRRLYRKPQMIFAHNVKLRANPDLEI